MVVAVDPAVGDRTLQQQKQVIRCPFRLIDSRAVGANQFFNAPAHRLFMSADHLVAGMLDGKFACGVEECATAVGR